jgi:hypothetical protein
MQPTYTVFGTVIRGAHGLLPWITLLAVATALALALTIGLSGLGGASALPANTSCDISGQRLQYVGLNSWIPSEPRVAPCPH